MMGCRCAVVCACSTSAFAALFAKPVIEWTELLDAAAAGIPDAARPVVWKVHSWTVAVTLLS